MSGRHILDNGILCVEISQRGAELCAVHKDGHDFMWQGDPLYWGSHSINLFPYVARMTDKTYTINGEPYNMDIHGFVKDRVLAPMNQACDKITFVLESDDETRAQYPFDFVYSVWYEIVDATLRITYTVKNRSGYTMYFGIGGHPGFAVPMEPDLKFEDYYLEFDEPCRPDRILFSKRLLVSGSEPYSLVDDVRLPLTHSLFDEDAIVLDNAAKSVCLKSAKGARSVTVEYPDFQYLGIWHSPGTDASFVCIEPWSSLPSREGVVEELTGQRDLICLAKGEVYKNVWSITFK